MTIYRRRRSLSPWEQAARLLWIIIALGVAVGALAVLITALIFSM